MGASGIFNACGSERMARYDFALMVAEILGLRTDLISPIETSDTGRAKRPLSAGMKIDKLLGVLGGSFKPRTVREALRDWSEHPGQHTLPLECGYNKAEI